MTPGGLVFNVCFRKILMCETWDNIVAWRRRTQVHRNAKFTPGKAVPQKC